MEGPNSWRIQYLWSFLCQKSLLPPSGAWGKESPGLDSIFPEFILHAGPAIKSWFCDFLTSCMRQLQNSKDLENSTNSCDPKAGKVTGAPKELPPYISAVCPLQKPRETHLHSCRDIDWPTVADTYGLYIFFMKSCTCRESTMQNNPLSI